MYMDNINQLKAFPPLPNEDNLAPENSADIFFTTSLYLDYERSNFWYICLTLILSSLIYISLLQYAWTFTAVILVFAGTYLAFLFSPTPFVEAKFYKDHLKFGTNNVNYSDLEYYFLQHLPSNDHLLCFKFKKNKKHDLHILMPKGFDLSKLNLFLMQYLPHKSDEEIPFVDFIFLILHI